MAERDHFAVGTAALNTSTGSQDLTVTSLGWTPKGILFWLTPATTLGTLIDHGILSMGMADDSGSAMFMSLRHKHNSANSVSQRQKNITDSEGYVWDVSTGSVDGQFTFDSDDATAGPISDGWRIDISNAPTNAVQVHYILIGGTDVSVDVLGLGTGASVGNTVTATPGFETNVGFVFGDGSASDQTTLQSHAIFSFGIFTWDGTTITQRCVLGNEPNNSASGNPQLRLETDSVHGQYFNGSLTWTGEVTSVSSTQVTVTQRDGGGGGDVSGLMCIAIPSGNETSLSTVDSPTSAGSDWTVSGLGITPEFALLLPTLLQSEDTNTVDSDAGTFNLAAYDGTAGASGGWQNEDAAATTNTSAIMTDQWVDVYDDAGSQAFDLDPSSSAFNSGGWTVGNADITAANGTTRKWVAFAFGEAVAGGATPPPYRRMATMGVGA